MVFNFSTVGKFVHSILAHPISISFTKWQFFLAEKISIHYSMALINKTTQRSHVQQAAHSEVEPSHYGMQNTVPSLTMIEYDTTNHSDR